MRCYYINVYVPLSVLSEKFVTLCFYRHCHPCLKYLYLSVGDFDAKTNKNIMIWCVYKLTNKPAHLKATTKFRNYFFLIMNIY